MTLTDRPVAAAPAPLRLRLLGTFRLTDAAGAPLALPTRKTRLLLAYLASPAGATHARERLAALLWPDRQPEQARGSLRNAIVALRAALGDAIRADRETCALVPGAVAVDVEALAALAADPEDVDPDAALALEAQEFLEGLTVEEGDLADWLAVERARQRDQLLAALHAGATQLCRDGRRAEAAALAARLVALDPLSERGRRLLMRIHAAAGERSLALAQFQVCRETLRRDLGVEPSPETAALAEAIASGDGADRVGEAAAAPPCALSLAVAPFANMSGDPAQDWLAEAFSNEIVTELARRRDLMVIARPPRRAPGAAGARYALSGAVRRAGGRLRVSARLIETIGDRAVWAERYERETGDLHAAQDEIVDRIAAAVDARMRRAEREAGGASPASKAPSLGAVS